MTVSSARRPGLRSRSSKESGPVSGSGLYLLPVAHSGNQNCSPEEAQAVGRLVRAILAGNATWVDREGQEKPITLDDIVIITPYNAQVFEIQQCLPGARVGTVDKFQGQEAPIAIYSTATSSHADAPRGMEFLYSLNRLGLEQQVTKGAGPVVGSGLYFLPVVHNGNQNCSPEEAEAVGKLVRAILAASTTWVDRDGKEQPITLDDVVIITPYNAQVFELQQCLPGARVGTVDKFQGQEAAIAIYSTATSSHADAPRGMEFLYSLNRLNVATSRAKCVSILVGSPQIFEAECRTPRQIQLANAFCRFFEMAKRLTVE